MCGFAGSAGNELLGSSTTWVLQRMGQNLAARGPDDESVFDCPDFRVIFRRLAINDVKGGRQPFVTRDGRFVAVVNGEIYNHRELTRQYLSGVTFASQSDCEVVIHLFAKLGAGFLRVLNGMFALAIWDQQERSLFLARDRLGIKPLYYTLLDKAVVFASELKSLLVHPRVPRTTDWEALDHVPNSTFPFARPAGGAVPTGIRGVSFVDPATYVQWHAGHVRDKRTYWKPSGPGECPENIISPNQCVERYAELVTDSVRLQLISDVPIGVFLSGGLDSSLLAAIASRYDSGLQAFTLVEPSINKTGDPEVAVQVARHVGMPLHLVRVDQEALRASMRLNLQTLEYFVWIMDFPLFDVEFLFKHELHRYAKSVNPNMKVILLGQGADEFAGGYSSLGSPNWKASTDHEVRSFHASLLRNLRIPAVYRRYLGTSLTRRLAAERAGVQEPWQYLRFGDLAAYNLWHEDRTAAANGMEARVPFLDHRLVEFLCSIPRQWHEELFFDKEIERRAALRVLPAQFARRPKHWSLGLSFRHVRLPFVNIH